MDLRDIDDLEQRLADAETRIVNLQEALTTSRRIGYAVGIVMAQHKVDDETAFAMLVYVSMQDHRKVRDIADYVVLTGTLPEQPPHRLARSA